VKKYLLSSAVAAAIFASYFAWGCFSSSPASAQAPAAGPSLQPYVYLVDMNYLFKKHARLSAERKSLTAEADKLQQDFEAQMRGVQERAKQLAPGGLLKVGTDDYNRLEEQLNKEKAAIQTSIQHKRREFILRESHLLFTAYTEISQEVKYYCEQHGIAIVINFNGDQMKEDNPDDVARGISRQVVYYNKALDITPYILPRIQGHEGTNSADRFNFNPNGQAPH
jgi:Skp family chaperone for outer membrane proteins